MATLPVVEAKTAVVTARDEHVVCVDSERVYNRLGASHRAQLVTFGTLPNSDLIAASGRKGVLGRMQSHGPDSFLVVGQRLSA